MGIEKVTRLPGVNREEYLENRVAEIQKQYDELKSLIGDLILDDVSRVRNENLQLKNTVANLTGQITTLKEEYANRLKRSQDTMRGQRKESEDNLCWEINKLKNNIRNKEKQIEELTSKNNQLNEEINNKNELLITQQVKLESREKEIQMLESVIEGITGIKVDTENILDKLNVFDNITLDVDYDKLVDKLNTEGSLIVLSKEEANSLVDIVIKNKNYLIKSTTGKGLVFDEEDLKRNIMIAYEYIGNGNKCTKETASKFGFNSTAALSSKMATIKKNYFDLIVEYKLTGLTNNIVDKYGESLSDVIELLKDKENWEVDWLKVNIKN